MTALALDQAFRAILEGPADRLYVEAQGAWVPLGRIAAVAEAVLAALGDLPADARIGLIARNRPDHVAALFGLLSRRRRIVMLHAWQAPDRLAAEVRGLGLAAVIGEADDWTKALREAAAEAGSLGIAMGDNVAPVSGTAWRGGANDAGDEDVAIEMLTSGTTGSPKRVPIRYATLTAAVEDAILATAQAGTGDQDAPYIQFYPLGNISGLFGLITCAVRGQAIVLLEKFTVAAWVRAVMLHRPSAFMSLPPAAIRMVMDADIPAEDLASIPVLRCGSAPLDPALQEAFEARYNIPILINYGATEFCGVIANWTLDDHRRFRREKGGSVGRARPGIDLRIVDPEGGAPVAAGETGLLEVRAERIAPGWVRTTDLGLIDADGFLFLKGRVDGVIIRGGFKLVPEAIAQALRAHPAIADAGVVGVADARLGEVPVAAIELKPGEQAPDAPVLMDLVRASLSPQAVPARILFVDALPRTGSLKIDRAALARLVAAQVAV